MTINETTQNDQPMEMIKSCGPTEAEMIQEILANNGIECSLQGELAANSIPAAGEMDEVRIWVRESDAERAGELVEAFFERETDADALGVDGPDEPFKA